MVKGNNIFLWSFQEGFNFRLVFFVSKTIVNSIHYSLEKQNGIHFGFSKFYNFHTIKLTKHSYVKCGLTPNPHLFQQSIVPLRVASFVGIEITLFN